MNHRITRALAASVVALGLGGGVAAAFVGSGHPSHASAASAMHADTPYFVCVGLLNTYGLCVGPPTNY